MGACVLYHCNVSVRRRVSFANLASSIRNDALLDHGGLARIERWRRQRVIEIVHALEARGGIPRGEQGEGGHVLATEPQLGEVLERFGVGRRRDRAVLALHVLASEQLGHRFADADLLAISGAHLIGDHERIARVRAAHDPERALATELVRDAQPTAVGVELALDGEQLSALGRIRVDIDQEDRGPTILIGHGLFDGRWQGRGIDRSVERQEDARDRAPPLEELIARVEPELEGGVAVGA